MDVVLVSVGWLFALVYLDGIVVHSKSTTDDVEQVGRVLRILFKPRLTLKLKIWKYFDETNDYLRDATRTDRPELASIRRTRWGSWNIQLHKPNFVRS